MLRSQRPPNVARNDSPLFKYYYDLITTQFWTKSIGPSIGFGFRTLKKAWFEYAVKAGTGRHCLVW